MRGLDPVGTDHLHASPDSPITRMEAARALQRHFAPQYDTAVATPGRQAVANGWMAVDHRNWFHPNLPLQWTDIRGEKLPGSRALPAAPGPVRRGEFFSWLLFERID
jgi:hypothetical protein